MKMKNKIISMSITLAVMFIALCGTAIAQKEIFLQPLNSTTAFMTSDQKVVYFKGNPIQTVELAKPQVTPRFTKPYCHYHIIENADGFRYKVLHTVGYMLNIREHFMHDEEFPMHDKYLLNITSAEELYRITAENQFKYLQMR